jgi:succinate dehydrogenase/fumarate reductase flavoprotein subunit
MPTWQEYLKNKGNMPEWPYPLRYDQQQEIETDVLVIGGGIAGCWAAISAARKGVKVALMEKGATIRSGAGGPGCDHWCDTASNPLSKVDPDEWARMLTDMGGGLGNGIGRQIQCRENYDTLLEMEQMGGKIRDYEGRFKDEQGYDANTKFLISPRMNPFHDTNVVIRIWGTTFKAALKKECLRLGVKIFDRVSGTSLLNEKGIQGNRVVGATGVNGRTGEFMIFKAKATILATAGVWSLWYLNTELAGYNTFRSRASSGDGAAMAYRAGAELTLMEKSNLLHLGTGYKHTWYTGAGDASYENVPLVDANGKTLPVVHEPGWGKKMGPAAPGTKSAWELIREGVEKGEYALPFYGDFPAMTASERDVTWNMLLNEESTVKNIVNTYEKAGFNPNEDMLQAYQVIEGNSPAQMREASGGGPVIDWNLKTTLDGLYAAGEQLFSAGDHSFAAATGRYAGRKAADYAKQNGPNEVSSAQINLEKNRVYAPIMRDSGIEWKELHAGTARVMQYFCSQYKTESLLNMGLDSLNEIENNWVPNLQALDPHKLIRSIEDTSLLTCAQIIINASLARKASSRSLDFYRIDYPAVDPPEWKKYVTVKLENGKVKTGSLPAGYWGDMVDNYEQHNKDYVGVCTKQK